MQRLCCFPSSAWETQHKKLCFPTGSVRSRPRHKNKREAGASGLRIPKRSLGTSDLVWFRLCRLRMIGRGSSRLVVVGRVWRASSGQGVPLILPACDRIGHADQACLVDRSINEALQKGRASFQGVLAPSMGLVLLKLCRGPYASGRRTPARRFLTKSKGRGSPPGGERAGSDALPARSCEQDRRFLTAWPEASPPAESATATAI
jgi:hypothetical protein